MAQATPTDWALNDIGLKVTDKFNRIHELVNRHDPAERAAVVGQSDFFKSWCRSVDLFPSAKSKQSKAHLHQAASRTRDHARRLLQGLDDTLATAVVALEHRKDSADKRRGKKVGVSACVPDVLSSMDAIDPKIKELIRFGLSLEKGLL